MKIGVFVASILCSRWALDGNWFWRK